MSANANFLYLQNQNGPLAFWQMDGGGLAGNQIDTASVLEDSGGHDINPGPNWFAMSIGGPYIALQNTDGSAAIWQTDGNRHVIGGGIVGDGGGHAVNPGSDWHIKGTGNFSGLPAGANHDLIWQNDDGAVSIWRMSGSGGNTLTGGGIVEDSGGHDINPGPTWHVETTGHFTDNTTLNDIALQNDDGSIAIWEFSGGGNTLTGGGIVEDSGGHAVNPGPSWHVKATGDFGGVGHTDLVLQNEDGMIAIWQMNGTEVVKSDFVNQTFHFSFGDGSFPANPGPTWHVKEAGTYGGEPSIVLQNDDGSVAVWQVPDTPTGALIVGGGIVEDSGGHPVNPGRSWNVINSNGDSMRFIYSTAANEVLAASAPTSDEFVFRSFAAGTHTITGFNPIQDVIEFSQTEFGYFAAVWAAITPVAGGSMIDLGGGSSLQLPGVSPTSLHGTNFVFEGAGG